MNKYEQAIKDIKCELSRNYKNCKWNGHKWVLKGRWQKIIALLEELARNVELEQGANNDL